MINPPTQVFILNKIFHLTNKYLKIAEKNKKSLGFLITINVWDKKEKNEIYNQCFNKNPIEKLKYKKILRY